MASMNYFLNKMNCQLISTNKVCPAVLLPWVMEAMFNRILFCCNNNMNLSLLLSCAIQTSDLIFNMLKAVNIC